MSLKPIQFTDKTVYQNNEQQCDLALGGFIRCWGHVEMAVFELFHKLSGTDIVTANIIFAAGIDQKTMREICKALGKERLKDDDFRYLDKLLERMKTAATTRNRLIHGVWQHHLIVDNKTNTVTRAEWIRFYEPTDPETVPQIQRKRPNQKLLAAHVFKLDRILALAKEAAELGQHLLAFVTRVSLQPVRVPQPVF